MVDYTNIIGHCEQQSISGRLCLFRKSLKCPHPEKPRWTDRGLWVDISVLCRCVIITTLFPTEEKWHFGLHSCSSRLSQRRWDSPNPCFDAWPMLTVEHVSTNKSITQSPDLGVWKSVMSFSNSVNIFTRLDGSVTWILNQNDYTTVFYVVKSGLNIVPGMENYFILFVPSQMILASWSVAYKICIATRWCQCFHAIGLIQMTSKQNKTGIVLSYDGHTKTISMVTKCNLLSLTITLESGLYCALFRQNHRKMWSILLRHHLFLSIFQFQMY